MLKSPFAFLGFGKRKSQTPKPNPQDNTRPKGKLRKSRHPKFSNTTVNNADQSTPIERGAEPDISPLAGFQETDPDRPKTDVTHGFSPAPQVDETKHQISSIITEDPSFSQGGKKPRVKTPVSVAPTRIWSTASSRGDSFGSGNMNPFTHEGDDRGEDWVNSEPDYLPKQYRAPRMLRSPKVDQPDAGDGEKESQQRSNNFKSYQSTVPQASPPEEDEKRARKENVSRDDRKPTVLKHEKDGFEPDMYYYIVPPGLDIIFQDEDGTEITRVGKTVKGTQDHSSHTQTKNIPIVVQDISGNEFFRSWTLEDINPDQGPLHNPNLGMADATARDDFARPLPSPNRAPWRTVIVDEKGNPIPLKYAEGRSASSFPT